MEEVPVEGVSVERVAGEALVAGVKVSLSEKQVKGLVDSMKKMKI